MSTNDILRELEDRENDLRGRAKASRQKAKELEAEAKELEQEAEEIRTGLRVLMKYTGAGDSKPEAKASINRLTLVDAAVKMLREAGKPLKASEIRDRLEDAGYGHDDPDTLRRSLNGVLSREFRKGKLLTRPESGRYGLREWREDDGVDDLFRQESPGSGEGGSRSDSGAAASEARISNKEGEMSNA